jgi:16S rRNA (guanine527-N7)-methyltransferase
MPNNDFNILIEGIQALCQNSANTDRIIAPRREEIFFLLKKYIAEIEFFNPAYGLVGTSDRRELVIKHILDSLAPLGVINNIVEMHGAAIADVGSGAGLPGIPLAVALPQVNVTLIERMGRRAGFLRNTQAALGLANVAIEETEMEKAAAGRFSLVMFRAFRPLEPKILKGLFRLCAEGGMLAAYKGRRENITGEMAIAEQALPKLAGQWKALPCPVPFLDEERHILLIPAAP